MSKPLTFGSLFAGIGGIDLGFERAGLQCKWQVEIDPFCRQVLAKHWPEVPRHDDIRTFINPPHVDIVVGGFPCKQTSNGAAIHGRRNGLAGKDSGLWYEMLRVIKECRPRVVVVENVAGVASWSETITGGLEDAGYGVTEFRIAASEFGAIHSRRRVFFVANTDRERLSVAWQKRSPEADAQERRAIAGDHWDAGSSEFRRMAHGISGALDRRARIERLGNAVVPQVAEYIGRRIMEIEQ